MVLNVQKRKIMIFNSISSTEFWILRKHSGRCTSAPPTCQFKAFKVGFEIGSISSSQEIFLITEAATFETLVQKHEPSLMEVYFNIILCLYPGCPSAVTLRGRQFLHHIFGLYIGFLNSLNYLMWYCRITCSVDSWAEPRVNILSVFLCDDFLVPAIMGMSVRTGKLSW